MADIFDFLVENNIRSMAFNPFIPQGRGNGFADKLHIQPEEFLDASISTLDRLLKYNRQRSCEQRARVRHLANIVANLTSSSPSYICLRSPCGAGVNQLAFSPNGDIYPCDALPQQKVWLGNIHRTKIQDVIENSNIISALMARTVKTLEECRECDWKWICGGGCPTHAYFKYGTLLRRGPFCEYYKQIIPHLIDLFYNEQVNPSLIL